MLEIRGLSFSYGARAGAVLRSVDLELRAGEIGVLLGRNGSGKTTLFKNILGLLRPSAGTVSLDGRDLLGMSGRERAGLIAYVPQDIRFGELTVFESVLMGRVSSFGFRAGKEDKAVAERIISEMHLENFAHRNAARLSGGERQLSLIHIFSCAGDLVKKGYDVTVFEALHKCGGVLAYGIPEFRLPKSIVDREVKNLERQGVKFVNDCIIGRTMPLDQLLEDGYEAVFIGSGAGLPQFMNIPGENLLGVYSANEYLTRINLMKAYRDDYDTPIKNNAKRIAVIGGGNVAMDAARCAKRMGADEVFIVYRRGRDELPARAEEVHHAEEEGIEFKLLNNPVEILGDADKHVVGLKCVKMRLGEPDASGRRSVSPIEGSEFVIVADAVIVAIGTTPNPLLRSTTPGLESNRKGCLIVNEDTLETSRKGVFAGGDAVTGAATVILAMGAGKHGAASIDEYIMGKK